MMEWTGLERWMEWNAEHRGVLNARAHSIYTTTYSVTVLGFGHVLDSYYESVMFADIMRMGIWIQWGQDWNSGMEWNGME